MEEEGLTWVAKLESRSTEYDESRYLEKMAKTSIYKWPHDLINVSGLSSNHSPQMASFGPHHHGEPHLLPMEFHKERALYRVQGRAQVPISRFVDSLIQVEQQLRDSYCELEPDLSSEAFLKMMLLDGCFMLELLLFDGLFQSPLMTSVAEPAYASAKQNDWAYLNSIFSRFDPIFSRHGKEHAFPLLRRDMLMLENQIPLLVLKRLLDVGNEGTIRINLDVNQLIVNFFDFSSTSIPNLSLHVLDVYRKCVVRSTEQRSNDQRPPLPFPWGFNTIVGCGRSATSLHEAGVKFKRSKEKSGLDIEFSKNGVLILPFFEINDHTAPVFMNMMAFERMHPDAGNQVTSYVAFMDDLVDTAEDVSLLSSKGILRNDLGSDDAAANLFNKLGGSVIHVDDPNDYISEVRRQLKLYASSAWNVWRANLMHTYFNNPWSFLSLFAAILLLALTIAQTVYSILAYHNSN